MCVFLQNWSKRHLDSNKTEEVVCQTPLNFIHATSDIFCFFKTESCPFDLIMFFIFHYRIKWRRQCIIWNLKQHSTLYKEIDSFLENDTLLYNYTKIMLSLIHTTYPKWYWLLKLRIITKITKILWSIKWYLLDISHTWWKNQTIWKCLHKPPRSFQLHK